MGKISRSVAPSVVFGPCDCVQGCTMIGWFSVLVGGDGWFSVLVGGDGWFSVLVGGDGWFSVLEGGDG